MIAHEASDPTAQLVRNGVLIKKSMTVFLNLKSAASLKAHGSHHEAHGSVSPM